MAETLRDKLIRCGWVTNFNADTLVKLIERHYTALAQPEPEGVPDAEALMAAWDSAVGKPRVGRLAEYRAWLAHALSLVWAVDRVQTQPMDNRTAPIPTTKTVTTMTDKKEHQFLLQLHQLLEDFDAELSYTRDDDGIHLRLADRELLEGKGFFDRAELRQALVDAGVLQWEPVASPSEENLDG
jgi:hypothetical protein